MQNRGQEIRVWSVGRKVSSLRKEGVFTYPLLPPGSGRGWVDLSLACCCCRWCVDDGIAAYAWNSGQNWPRKRCEPEALRTRSIQAATQVRTTPLTLLLSYHPYVHYLHALSHTMIKMYICNRISHIHPHPESVYFRLSASKEKVCLGGNVLQMNHRLVCSTPLKNSICSLIHSDIPQSLYLLIHIGLTQ